ncbi:ComEC/Rec2 family competence protein [Mucilaginibacter terrae]|uniref:ComEC/Rec2 family competence protein n=1 Tax=Mucilaginibacter terrae TaxID=1955052 RepID=UPI0036418D8B
MLRAHKGEISILYWLLPFMAGIVLGLYSEGFFLFPIGVGTGVFACLLFISLNLLYNKINGNQFSWVGSIAMHLFLLCAGWLSCQLNNDLVKNDHFSKAKANFLIAQIINEPQQKGIYTRFTVKVTNTIAARKYQSSTGKILVTLVADSNSHLVNYGDQLLIPANYKPVDPPFNPAEFNYKQYLAHQNIYHQSFITRAQFRVLQRHTGNLVIAYSLRVRQQLVNSIKLYIHDKDAAAIASTLLLGYKADMSADILQAYSKTGTIHVLSVSGAHVAIIFVVIAFLLKPFRHYRYGRVFNALLSLILIWGYAILTGLSPAVCRAAVMLTMLIISQASGRPVHALNVLAVSAFALLLYNPFLITDVGFQLSFIAVFGLVAIQPIIEEQLELKNKWVKKFWKLCALSLAAQLVTFPLSAYYFHQFPLYFLISNLLIIVPAEVIVIGGMVFLMSSCFELLSPLTAFLGYVLEQSILLMNKALIYIEHLPFASIGQIWFTPWEHLLLYLIIGCFIYFLLCKHTKQLAAALLCLLILCTCLSWKGIQKHKANHIIFFNVKKNSAILFQTGREAVLVTDLTPQDKNYSYSIQPCLDSLGVDSVIICQPAKNMQNSFFRKQEHLMQFKNKSVLWFNPSLQKAVLSPKINIDYLFFTHNPHSNLTFIHNNYNFKLLIADANNLAQHLSQLQHEADSLHLKINILRRNNSFIVASKYINQ